MKWPFAQFGSAESTASKVARGAESQRLYYPEMVAKYGGNLITVYDAFYKKQMSQEDYDWFQEAFLTQNGMMIYALHRIVEHLDHVQSKGNRGERHIP